MTLSEQWRKEATVAKNKAGLADSYPEVQTYCEVERTLSRNADAIDTRKAEIVVRILGISLDWTKQDVRAMAAKIVEEIL